MRKTAHSPHHEVLCPICQRPLEWSPDRWLAVFECERCGQFSDFSSITAQARATSNKLAAGLGPVLDADRKS